MPNKAKEALKEMGSQIRLARKRRHWTIAELSKKIAVSSPTMIALEKGEPTVSVGILVAALWTLGLDTVLRSLANPIDVEGIKLMDSRLPKKYVRLKRL